MIVNLTNIKSGKSAEPAKADQFPIQPTKSEMLTAMGFTEAEKREFVDLLAEHAREMDEKKSVRVANIVAGRRWKK